VAFGFFVAASYLLIAGLIMLLRPGLVPMSAGAALLDGLELAGPYMFLLVAGVGGLVAFGLWRLKKWARWMAILVASIGIVMLVPVVSSAILDFRVGRLAWTGLETVLRVMVVWYLWQAPVIEAFA
jgi:uncharacterized membrane protein (DUF2068 family)